MGVIERRRGLPQDVQGLFAFGNAAGGEHVLERRPVHALHGDVGQILMPAQIVDHDNARMRKRSGRARFAEQSFLKRVRLRCISQRVKTNGLDGDGAIDQRIAGFEDDTHRAAAQFADHLVASDLRHGVF